MNKKTWVMVGAVLAAVVAAVAGFVILKGGKQESYRSIMVYQVNGSASITRERVGAMDAYENLMLLSGDIVEVAQDSNIRLKLDDDKYLLAEPDTVLCIRAEGDADNSKTYIDLQKGSVTNEIQNKLGSGSSYEVNTPNSIMAVRGTVFRVALAQGKDGEFETKIDVFDGAVKVNPVLPDGTVLEAEAAVEAGKEITIGAEQISSGQISEPVDIDYENLPPVMQEYLIELSQKEQALPAKVVQSIQDVQETWESNNSQGAIDSQSNVSGSTDAQDAQKDAGLKKGEEEADKKESAVPAIKKEQDNVQENKLEQKQENKPDAVQEKQKQEDLQLKQQDELLKKQEETQLQILQKQQEELLKQQQEALLKQQEEAKKQQEETKKKQASVQQNPSAGTENNSSGGGGGGESKRTVESSAVGGSSAVEGSGSVESSSAVGGSGSVESSTAEGSSSVESSSAAESSSAVEGSGSVESSSAVESSSVEMYYIVTFKYNGSVFGTQSVKRGEKATAPKLSPAPSGKWDDKLAQAVMGDMVIDWINN